MQTLLTLTGVSSALHRSRSSIYSDIAQGTLPRPVKLGERSVAWPQSEIAAIQNARIAGKSEDEIRELVSSLQASRGKVGEK